MSNTKHTVLMNEWQPDSEDCRSFREDLRIAIVLNPSLEKIEAAMDEWAKLILTHAITHNLEFGWGIYCDDDGTYDTIEEYYSHIQNAENQNTNP